MNADAVGWVAPVSRVPIAGPGASFGVVVGLGNQAGLVGEDGQLDAVADFELGQ